MVSNTLTVAGAIIRPESAPAEHKFPIETYVGLEKETAERVAKFEAETKAMLTQRSGLAKSSQDIREAVSTSHHRHGELHSDLSQLVRRSNFYYSSEYSLH